MKVLVEALGISKFGGGRSATLPLFEGLLPQTTDDQFTFVLDAFEPTIDYPHVQQVIAPTQHRFKARLWLQAVLPYMVAKKGIDLVHFAKNLTVTGIKAKTLATLYDLTLLQFPNGFSRADLWYWRVVQPRMLRQVTQIQAISQNTADELKHFYQLSDDKIQVIYPPCHPSFRPLPDDEIQQIRNRYNLPERTIMHVGSIGPKKNLDTLLRAFGQIAERVDGKLVFVGGPYRPGYDAPLRELVAELKLNDKVIFTGIVPLSDLPGLINAATIVTYPSMHEGFGIVAVEAMACGKPLIVAPGGALPETVADAAVIMKDPFDVDELANELYSLCCSEDRRRVLQQRSLQRVQHFAPEHIGRQVLDLYHEVTRL